MNGEEHTGSPLPDFLRHYPKDRDNLNHDLHDDISHGCRRSDHYICLKALEEEFHAAKEVDESIFASSDILNTLRGIYVTEIPC
jgi:hypothetical protein